MINLVRQHLSRDGWRRARPRGVWPSDKMRLILALLTAVHGTSERCALDLDPGRLIPTPLPTTLLRARPADNTQNDAPPCDAARFDVRRLPYRWLPGLAPHRSGVRDLLTVEKATSALRLEVMHIADYWPGPVWLYHAPGSGVWWSPGRRVVARNLVDVILKFNPMDKVVAHLDAVGNGDRRLNRYRAWLQWRVAFGGHDGPSWAAILAGARAGNASFEHFASAGELLGSLITAGDGYIPKDVDSIILREQTHFWPRGSTWDVPDDGYAPSMVRPCAHEARHSATGEMLHVRTHRVPEIVDLRAQRGNKRTKFGAAWRAEREIPHAFFRHVAAEPEREGHGVCMRARAGSLCTSCDADGVGSISRMCMCATMPPPLLRPLRRRARKGNPLSMLTRPDFEPERARECCLANQTR